MSLGNATPATIRTPAGVRHPMQALRETLQFCWPVAEFAKRRLRLALAFVASGTVLAATAIALELVLDFLAQDAVSQREELPTPAVQG